MEKIVFITKDYTSEINDYLRQGWKVKNIIPVFNTVALSGTTYSSKEGDYGAYVVIVKE